MCRVTTPLQLYSFCLLLDPKISNPSTSFEKQKSKWLPLYRVEKILTHSNYLVRKVGTHYTYLVDRIKLRPIKPQFVVNDLEAVDPSKLETDPNIEQHEKEPYLLDAFIETSLEISPEPDNKQVQFDSSPSETIKQAAEPPNSTANNIPSLNDEFLVEGHITSEQNFTVPSIIDTSENKFGQQENHPSQI